MNPESHFGAVPRAWPTWPATPGIPLSPDAWRPTARARGSLARGATLLAGAFVLSRLLGLLREVILAHQFGTTGVKDALVAAFLVPDLLFLVMMAGSFGSAFIPVFAGLIGRSRDDEAWELASVVLTLSALTLFVSALLVYVFAGSVILLVAPKLDDQNPALAALAADLMRVLLLSPIFLGLGIAAKGILEGQERFTLPAFAPVVYNAAIILGALLLVPRFGPFGVAIGVVVGALAHFMIQLPGLVRSGMKFRPSLNVRTPGLAEVGRLLGPRLLGQAAFQINFVVVYGFANGLGEGPASALNFAWLLLMLPHGILALSISTVVFPAMSRLYQQGRIDEFRAMFAQASRLLFLLSAPAAVLLFFFRVPIVQLLYQRGAFDAASTRLVADPVAFFAIGLVSYALVEVLTRAFYAMHDTRTPVIAGVLTIILNIILCAALVGSFGHVALALSLSLTTTIEGVILFTVLRGRLGAIGPRRQQWLVRASLATLCMVVVAWLVSPRVIASVDATTISWLVRMIFFAFAVVVVGGSYVVAGVMVGIPEFAEGSRRLAARLPIGRRRLSHEHG